MDDREHKSLLDSLDSLAGEGRAAEVERMCRRALGDVNPEQAMDIAHHLHDSLTALGRPREARGAAEACGAVLCRATAAFDDWDLEAARSLLRGFIGSPEENAYADHWRGVLAEFAGHDGRRWFERAARAFPAEYWVPPALGKRDARAICLRVLRSLPRALRKGLRRLPVYVLDVPKRRDVGPLVLGCAAWDAIEIYRLNIARWSRDVNEATEELRRTLLHEIGHVYGMDHRVLDKLGL